MRLSAIEAKTLPEAWFLCLKEVMEHGYEYKIDTGSFEGQKRKELDFITLKVEFPGSRPIIPVVPEGVPPPVTMDYVEKDYLAYLLTGDKKEGETYTYGQDIEPQIQPLIDMYKKGFETNTACMSVGDRKSITISHSQCLRLIDTRVRYGKLHFMVYFRSWDLWGGFPANLAAIQLLKEYIAGQIGVDDGELIACSKGLHLYDHCWELANVVLGRQSV